MTNIQIVNIHSYHHRSIERIKHLGEVFTPEEYVRRMLELLCERDWSDENLIFFEPTCGHGNFVVPIFEKRINSFYKKYQGLKLKAPLLHAVANALNTLWAIDVCKDNVELTRKRVFDLLISKLKSVEISITKKKSKEFLAHALCSIIWQIQENDALSSLSHKSIAISSASKIKISKEWYGKNGHRPIIFELDWCEYFRQVSNKNTTPLPYQRAIKFVESKLNKTKTKGLEEFSFAVEMITELAKLRIPKNAESQISCGT